jgi:probable F420-dependent oxidoreductase
VTRSFRFGCQATSAGTADGFRALARKAEDLGYSSFSVPDHYLGPGPAMEAALHPPQDVAMLPALAVAAEATSTIRVGCRVACVGYHQPVVLAKELATVDWFAGGRLEAGLGAGWIRSEYEAMGIPFPSAGERIERLTETVELLRSWSTGAPIEMKGDHIHAAGFAPLPAAAPPIMIGGGSKRVLELAGREADIVSVNFDNRSGTLGPAIGAADEAATEEKLRWVQAGAEGRATAPELEIGAYFTLVTDARDAVLPKFAARLGLSADKLAAHPHALIGTASEIADELCRRRERFGFSYVTVDAAMAEPFAPVVARLRGS